MDHWKEKNRWSCQVLSNYCFHHSCGFLSRLSSGPSRSRYVLWKTPWSRNQTQLCELVLLSLVVNEKCQVDVVTKTPDHYIVTMTLLNGRDVGVSMVDKSFAVNLVPGKTPSTVPMATSVASSQMSSPAPSIGSFSPQGRSGSLSPVSLNQISAGAFPPQTPSSAAQIPAFSTLQTSASDFTLSPGQISVATMSTTGGLTPTTQSQSSSGDKSSIINEETKELLNGLWSDRGSLDD